MKRRLVVALGHAGVGAAGSAAVKTGFMLLKRVFMLLVLEGWSVEKSRVISEGVW